MTEAEKQERTYRFYGANSVLQNQIRALAKEGASIEEISEKLNVHPKCVKSFMNPEAVVEKKAKAAANKATGTRKKAAPAAKKTEEEKEDWER